MKHKKSAITILIALLLSMLLIGCADRGNVTNSDVFAPEYFRAEDFVGKKISTVSGTVFDQIAAQHIPGAEHVYFNSTMDGIEALKSGRIDAVIEDDAALRLHVANNPGLRLLEPLMTQDEYGVVVTKDNPQLLKELNEFIAVIMSDGTYDDMLRRWLDIGGDKPMPDIPEGSGKVLNFGTSGIVDGFSFYSHGQLSGFDIEFVRRFAEFADYRLDISVMDFGALIPAVVSGRIDFAATLFTITEERKQSINFTDPYYYGGVGVAVFDPQSISKRPAVESARVGVMIGSTNEIFAETNYPQAELHRFNNYVDSSAALLGFKLDYAMMDYTSALNFTRNNVELEIVSDFLTDEWLCIGISMDNPELHRKISEVVDRYLADGTMDEIIANWLRNDGSDYPEIEFPRNENAPVLTMAIVSSREPTTFISNGKYVGADIELMERIAYELGYQMSYLDMEWGAVVPAMASSRADVCLGMYSTPERREKILFTTPYLKNPQVLIARKLDTETIQKLSFWQNLKVSFERNLINENRWRMIVDGLGVSLIITIFAFALATLAGFGVCGLRMSKNRLLRVIGSIYITVLRGTPIVVLLMITFYIIFARTNVSSITIAIIAFGANGAAFIGEIIRSAILTIDKGQIEAARSMGFSKIGAFFTVTFPQAVQVAFPVYMSEFISMFKLTSIVGYIAIMDLTRAGDIIRSRTYDAFFPLIMIAMIYLVVASIMIYLFNLINIKTNKRLRRVK